MEQKPRRCNRCLCCSLVSPAGAAPRVDFARCSLVAASLPRCLADPIWIQLATKWIQGRNARNRVFLRGFEGGYKILVSIFTFFNWKKKTKGQRHPSIAKKPPLGYKNLVSTLKTQREGASIARRAVSALYPPPVSLYPPLPLCIHLIAGAPASPSRPASLDKPA